MDIDKAYSASWCGCRRCAVVVTIAATLPCDSSAALKRQNRRASPSVRSGIHAALRAYTMTAARQMFLEKRIGSLEAGKEADIAVWDRNPYTVPAAALKDMKCEMTLLHGRIIYQAP
jgi:predicted amidohydrolase YtcJ